MTDIAIEEESATLPEATRLELRLSIDLRPQAGQAADEARRLFLETLSSYLRDDDGPFLEDFGVTAWGGYAGPYVLEARLGTVSESTGIQLIADELARQSLAEQHGRPPEPVPEQWLPSGIPARELHKLGAAIARRIDELGAPA